jgi:hypothetical protein
MEHETDDANLAAERVEAILGEATKALGEIAYVDVTSYGWVSMTVPAEVAARICLEAPGATRTVALSDTAWAVICGMVQTTDAVETEAIIAEDPVWDEIREAFPLAAFRQAVDAGMIEYDA